MDRILLKLGGSLITDKTGVEAPRLDVLARLAGEIAAAGQARRNLVVGHGSGSFGHVAAARYGTRQGVSGADQWLGFAEVAQAAAQLNRLVVGALLQANVPAFSLSPSASAVCHDGQLVSLNTAGVSRALKAGLLPVIHGDVAFDGWRGGTIISTEEVMIFLARSLPPTELLLAGEVPGVLNEAGQVIPVISPANFAAVAQALGGSRGTDVTGGMASKVAGMLQLARDIPGLGIRIFSGLETGLLRAVLAGEAENAGTLIVGR